MPALIMGQSGTGKSYSLRNLPSEHTALFNVIGKPSARSGKSLTRLRYAIYRPFRKSIGDEVPR